jgi:hypothetical protein
MSRKSGVTGWSGQPWRQVFGAHGRQSPFARTMTTQPPTTRAPADRATNRSSKTTAAFSGEPLMRARKRRSGGRRARSSETRTARRAAARYRASATSDRSPRMVGTRKRGTPYRVKSASCSCCRCCGMAATVADMVFGFGCVSGRRAPPALPARGAALGGAKVLLARGSRSQRATSRRARRSASTCAPSGLWGDWGRGGVEDGAVVGSGGFRSLKRRRFSLSLSLSGACAFRTNWGRFRYSRGWETDARVLVFVCV